MGKRGPKPKREKVKWSPEIAYAVGLITTDGSLSKNGRHIDLTSKDKEQLENFLRCIGREDIPLREKSNGRGGKVPRVQLSDVVLYQFLTDKVGLTPAKTKTLADLSVPKQYFFDFLRGHFDGDGTFYSFWDKRWKSSFMYYTVFIAKSEDHILWLRKIIEERSGAKGHLCKDGRKSTFHLKYAKKDSMKLLPRIYYSAEAVCLSRKRLKIEKALSIVGKSL